MKRLSLMALLLVSLILIAVGLVQLNRSNQPTARITSVANSAPSVPRIDVATLAARLGEPEPPLVWELRSAESYAQSHIPGSTRVDYEQIELLSATVERNRQVVTVCA